MKYPRIFSDSGIFVLSGWRGSNPWPLAWEANALPLSYTRISDSFDDKDSDFSIK